MAKRINREEIKAEVKRRQQNAARDYAEKANLIAAGYKTAKTNSASGSAGKKPIGASNSKSNVLSQIDEIRNDLGSRNKLSADALMANNPAYVYTKAYGDGKTGAAANKVIKGAASARDAIAASDDAITRNNPAYSYLQREGATTVTRGSDAITENPSSVEWYKKILRGIDTGLTSFGQSLTSLADVVTSLGDESGGPLQELWYMFGGDRIMQDNPVKALNKLGQSEVDYRSRHNASLQDDPFYKYSAMLGETIPMLIPSIMTGGATAFGEAAGAASELAAASKVGQTASNLGKTYELVKNSLKNLASRPDAQTIFGSVLGSSYDEAKQDGADDGQALTYAILNGVANTVTELGGADTALGGLQNLPSWLKNAIEKGDKSLLLNYAKSVGEEASEELIQGILGRGFKSLYSDVPLYDPDNENSIINPEAAIDEATGAAVVTTLLGLPTVGINAQRRARQNRNAKDVYGNSQQELVNEGLQSDQSSESYELAQKYNEKLSEGKKLSGNELYKLAKANEDAITQEQTVQSAAPIETNTPEIDVPEITDTAVRSDIPYVAMQRNAPITAQTYNAPINFGGIQQSAQIQSSVKNLSAKYNVSDELIGRVYNLNPTAPQAFETAFNAVYQMGQQGTDKAALGKVPVLSTAQANIAYQMGADSVMSTETAAPVTNNNTQEVNDNGVRIHNVAERINGQNTEGQIRGVETGTGENVAGGSQKEQGGISAAQIKAGEKVSYKGKQQKGVYYAAEDTEDMKKGRKLAESYGYKVTYFVGGNIRYAGGEFRGVVDTAKKTVMVRADHPDYTAEQIMRHEMGHAAFENGDLSIDEAREMLLDEFTADEINELIEIYNSEYGGILSADEAFEEICCDALGRMNIFEGTDLNSESYGKAQDTVRKYAVDKTGSKGRAPPKGGEMYSREVNGKKIAWIENNPLSLKDLTNYKKVAAYIADHIGEVYTILESGSKVYIGENLPSEYTQSEYTKRILKNVPPILKAKNKAIGRFGEMIEIATNRRWEKAKHTANKDAKYGVYRYSTAFAFPVNQNGKVVNVKSFDAELIILNSSDGKKYLYDIVNIKENTADEVDLLKRDQMRQNASARRGASENSIRSSSENVNEKFSREVKNAEEYFGTTYKVKEAGYICTDGKMLDFSGRHEGAPGGYRTVDHRDITAALGEDYGGEDYSGGMIKFMSEGNIRVSPESGGINLSVAPNKAQRSTLDRYISSFRGEVILDIDRTNGDTIASVEYPKYTNSSVVFKDIDDYFDKGKIPEKFSREPVSDSAYMKAVERGDTESAQRMVDEAAKKAGYTVKMYHGSKRGGGFTVFRDWSYFTKSKKYAQRYTESGNDKSLYSAYVKIENAFDTRKAADRYLFDEIRQEYGMGEIQDTGLPDWTDGYDIADYIDENGLNYDAIILDEGGDLVDGKPISRGLSYVIRNSNNIKSAEPITYDNNGNVIPLSERFKDNNPDIRYSREPERLNELRRQNERKLAQATAEDAANENERGLIRDYQKQYSKVEGIREKLSAAQQALTEAEDSGADYDTTTKAKNRFTLLSKQYAREHRKLNGYGSTKALQNVLKRVSARTSKDAGHIDNRNFSSVSDRSVKPFQMEHPELHKYYEDMAQTVLYDIGMATQFRTTNGYPKTKFTDEFKRALGGSSFNDGLQALLDISNDQGSENYALAKRMELFLDDLLTNGYKGASGNAEYIRAKENISGGNTAWENYLEENSLAIADGLITEKELYQEFMQMRSDLPEGMGAASANFTGEETVGERWVTEAQGKGDSALHPISKEQEANLAEQQHRAPQEIPKEDLNGKLTSKHVSTIANSGMTPAEFSDALREDAALGKFSHIAYSDEEALKKAERAISDDGWDQALANYKAEINSGRVSKDNTVMGIALYNNAVNSGDYATAMDIASLMVKNSTNTAQSLQAMRILNKLSPECRLYLAAKSIENIEEDLNERYKDNKADIHVDEILYDEYAKALRQGDEDGIKTAWANIEQSVAQQINATWYEKLNNFRYLAMLGNPRTHVRNIVGNAFFVPVRAVKNTIAYGLENIADAKINGGIERSKAILNSSNAADAALVKYAMSDYEAVQEVILSGGKYVDTFQGIDKHRTIYKTKILEAARKGNSAALDAEDAWFCKPAYANALAKWYKANGITAEQLNTGKVPEETIIKAQTIAIKEAQKATYRDTNWFSAQVSRLGKVDNKVAAVLIEGVLPFKKTPANILARAVEYSPVGLIKSLALDTKKVKAYVNGDIENGMSPAEFIDDISAGLTGSALMGLGILLASWGVLSGGDDDDEKQNYFDELSGKQNYALSIGGMSITLDWLAPESMPLFVGVELFNSLSSKNEDKGFLQNLMSSVMSLSTPMFEMSMLQSVNDLFDNLAYIKQGQGTFKIVSSMAANYISQYFPTLFGQGERAFGETQRETTYVDRNSAVGSELQYMWGKIANKIPFYDFSQIPYIDAWGRTEETGNLFERMLNNFVNPAYVKKERPTEIDGELERLYDLGETSVYPSRAKTNTKINGEYLTADEYVKYATTKGQTSYELAQGVINSAAYSGAADPEKAYMLKYVYSYADHIAKYEVNNDYSLAKWEMAAYKSANPMQAIIDHAREYYNPDKEN